LIQGPRLYAQMDLPSGPTWKDIERLIDSIGAKSPSDIRDRAIVLLFAMYGLRSSEVVNLRLDDINWQDSQITFTRTKQRRTEEYPLAAVVGNALIYYLRTVRQRSTYREVFLTRIAPYKPLSVQALHSLLGRRMVKAEISPQRSPKSLRHACATHLLNEGLSLKEIGDHLGHRKLSTTQVYAKVDLPNLCKVAQFNFGGAL
jgi:site-specific recombinase XerD